MSAFIGERHHSIDPNWPFLLFDRAHRAAETIRVREIMKIDAELRIQSAMARQPGRCA